jgi:hypothetical protein
MIRDFGSDGSTSPRGPGESAPENGVSGIGPNGLRARCPDCETVSVLPEWKPGARCPECGRPGVIPVPLVTVRRAYLDVERHSGPAPQDHRFGMLAVWCGYVTRNQVSDCIAVQKQLARRGLEVPPIGDLLVQRNMMTPDQADRVLHVQQIAAGSPDENQFGHLAVTNRMLSPVHLEDCLREQQRLIADGEDVPLLGQIAVQKKFMTTSQVQAVLRAQMRNRTGVLYDLEKIEKENEGDRHRLTNLTRDSARAALIALGIVTVLTLIAVLF